MKETNDKLLKQFYMIGHWEGISFLVLLFIAMPLKYFFDMPKAVSVVGMAHGVLFVAYAIWLFRSMETYKWTLKKAGIAFLLSFIPFGTFYLHKLK